MSDRKPSEDEVCLVLCCCEGDGTNLVSSLDQVVRSIVKIYSLDTFQWENWGLTIERIGMLFHQSGCSGSKLG